MMLVKNPPRKIYKLRDGTLVPGATTVIGELRKPALDKWHWESGWDWASLHFKSRDGFKEWRESAMDSTAGVGSIAHYKVHCAINGEEESYSPLFAGEHIEMADLPFKTFMQYYKSRGGCAILSEYSQVHEVKRYGGTLDLLLSTKDGIELWDIKTSKAIYEEYWIQLAAYMLLLNQDSKYRAYKITPRIVLVTKDGRLEAPAAGKAYFDKAKKTWVNLVKMYHHLNEFRKAA